MRRKVRGCRASVEVKKKGDFFIIKSPSGKIIKVMNRNHAVEIAKAKVGVKLKRCLP